MKKILLIATSVALVACQSSTPELSDESIPMKPLAERMMCTAQYDPVCATFEIKGKTVKKTFGNACGMNVVAIKAVSTTKGACQ